MRTARPPAHWTSALAVRVFPMYEAFAPGWFSAVWERYPVAVTGRAGPFAGAVGVSGDVPAGVVFGVVVASA